MTFRRTRCAHCKKRLDPERPSQIVHMECAAAYICAQHDKREREEAKKARMAAKVERATTRARKQALKPVGQIEEECRRIVQKLARIRDREQGCISCDKPASWDGQWHGSHYRAHGGCSSLQFHLWNINKACWICNKIFSGRRDGYQLGIVARYGEKRLEWLDAQPKSQRYGRDYLERFKKVMGKRLRRMEKRLERA